MKTMFRLIGMLLNVLSRLSPELAGRIGFRLFCYPVRRKVSPKQRQYLRAARSFQLAVEGERVAGYRWGWGPKQVLLLHGWSSDSYYWRSLVESLSPHEYSIVAFDAPGHGLSSGTEFHFPRYRDCIRACTAQQGPFDYIIGHSFGAAAAYYTLSSTPDIAVKGLCMLATPSQLGDFFDQWSALLNLSTPVKKNVVVQSEFRLGISIPSFSFQQFAAPPRTTPGLILHDPADPESPFEGAKFLASQWRDAQLIELPGEGHNMRSSAVNSALKHFLGGQTNLKRPTSVRELSLMHDDLLVRNAQSA